MAYTLWPDGPTTACPSASCRDGKRIAPWSKQLDPQKRAQGCSPRPRLKAWSSLERAKEQGAGVPRSRQRAAATDPPAPEEWSTHGFLGLLFHCGGEGQPYWTVPPIFRAAVPGANHLRNSPHRHTQESLHPGSFSGVSQSSHADNPDVPSG